MEKISGHISIEHAQLFLRPDGIIEIRGSDHTYTLEDIQRIHSAIAELSGNQKVALLLLASTYTSMTNEVQQFLSTPEAVVHSIAEAYVINSLAQRLLLRFLTKVSGTHVPVQFFSDSEQAVKWLKSKMNK